MTVSRLAWMAGLALLIATAATALAAEDLVLRITKEDCARLVGHAPAPGVAHQPGVDVHGRAIVPADLESSTEFGAADHFLIPLEIDLAARLGLPANPDRFEADVFIGVVEVRGARAYFNGRPLQSEAEADLASICREAALEP